MEIALKIENKNIIVENEVKIVNSNTDYVLKFTFDEEWDEFNEKTLRIEFNNNDYVDTIFTGNTVTLPPIFNQKNFRLGVYAGDLHSTTALVVYCKDSIVDGKGDEYILKPTGSIEITNTEEVDVTHYAKAQVVDDNLVAENIKKDVNILGIEGSYEPEPPTAEEVSYDNTTSGLQATNVQDAIDEVVESGGGGSEVVVNPTLAGTEARMTGIEVDGTKYKNDYLPLSGGTVSGNITLGGTTYAIRDSQGNDMLRGASTVIIGTTQKPLQIATTNTDISHSRAGIPVNLLDGENTSANPTLEGTEARLTSIKINGTSYKNDYLPLSGGVMEGGIRIPYTTGLYSRNGKQVLIAENDGSGVIIGNGDNQSQAIKLYTGTNGTLKRYKGAFDQVGYDMLDTSNTQANPTLEGTETELTGLKLNGTNYKVGGGDKLYMHNIRIQSGSSNSYINFNFVSKKSNSYSYTELINLFSLGTYISTTGHYGSGSTYYPVVDAYIKNAYGGKTFTFHYIMPSDNSLHEYTIAGIDAHVTDVVVEL